MTGDISNGSADEMLSDQKVFQEITSSLQILKTALSIKNISYLNLKRALVPNVDKNEVAFVFDWSMTESSWYGKEVIEIMLPMFDRRSTHSILCGDWIYTGEHNASFCDDLKFNLIRSSKRYKGQCDNLYFVYINNLSDSMVNTFDDELSSYSAYLGYLDLRFMSAIKAFLRTSV